MQETERIEFKERLTDDIYKEIIAFANTDGGTIYVGINDHGEPVGLEDVDDVYTRITNGVRDAILPDVTIFVKYTLEDGEIIKMEIGEGSYKPYYLKVKGLKPSGVYVRQGTSAVPASPEQIRLMIKNADGDVFEDLRSLEQELTFQAAAKAFARHGLDLRPEKYDALGIRSRSLVYTPISACCYRINVPIPSKRPSFPMRRTPYSETAGSFRAPFWHNWMMPMTISSSAIRPARRSSDWSVWTIGTIRLKQSGKLCSMRLSIGIMALAAARLSI